MTQMLERPMTPSQNSLLDYIPVLASDHVVTVDNLWSMIWRRRWRCIAVFTVVCLLGGLACLTLSPQYTAHTVMSVASTQPDLAATDQVTPPASGAPSRDPDVEAEIVLITSKSTLLKMVRDLHLDRDPEFQVEMHDWRATAAKALHQRWASLIQGNWSALFAPSSERLDAISASPESGPKRDPEAAAAEFVSNHLTVKAIGKSPTVDISVTAAQPDMAARLANAVGENYIRTRQAAKLEQASRASHYLAVRSEQLLAEVTAAATAAEDFRAANMSRDGHDIDQLKAEMDAINAQIVATRIAKGAAKAKLEAAEARIKQFGIVGALDSDTSRLDDRLRELEAEAHTKLAAITADRGPGFPDIRRAQQEYNAAHSEVVQEAQERLTRLRSDVTIAEQQRQMLEDSLRTTRSEFNRLSVASSTLNGLMVRATAARNVYETFLERLKRTEQVGFNEAQSWVIAPATAPLKPSSSKALIIACVSLLLATAAALAMALLAEHEDRGTILSLQQVKDKGLKSLGIVPYLRRREPLEGSLIADADHSNSVFSESIGSVFTSIMELADRERSALVLLVTSSLPFEGKSTTVTALASKAASAGKRVLLIDADLRAPRLHRAFNITTERGVTECLDPSHDLGDSIYVDPKTGIEVLAAGPRHPAPQNVLRSPRLREAIETWRTLYDFILVDSPPVLPIADARILVPMTDYCVFVTQWRKTRWSAALHAITLLRESGARLAGIVVSKVDVKQLATYGFADSAAYGRSYRQYLTEQ
jgi:polysaccharide biosynthesis transport protein